ncbi:hypothetical protein HBA55_34645 [Pseudomaricurvus alkylphenolicus]|uniref:phage tail tape measure protein n=1 Tax=Pseudomaricurvus alkylphenolicus TaxID=1306991 RepID=UPI00141DB070|nr:phage tail tape measure protein [Pseudomaricurvus alkylphenolicus]NIB44771.1 hypothetical protein [Pseudomaricurvus alkylphenolicus]
MSSRFEKLMFTISMIDKITGPANKVAKTIDDINRRTTAGLARMGVGVAGLWGAGRAIEGALAPAIAMDRAVGEVKSLGVADAALRQLERTSLRFSIKYGEVATDFVSSSYDIQSAIAGLTGGELSKFTLASGVLAKATKSDSAVITDYMGTMYGIFQNQANAMGKAQWVEMLTGQTANAVQMFKTTGSEMAASFANLGAEAQSHGVAMSEQMAILGTLQATMSGSEAGTKYRAFLAGVGKAQDKLNLKFTDSNGRLLPMIDILQKLQGKFGDIDKLAESDVLKKAFGSAEAVGLIKLLSQNVGGLQGSIAQLGQVKGMEKAEKMAQAMVDPWERLSAAGIAVRTVFGRVVQPVLLPVLDSLTSGADTIMRWTEMFPNLTRVVGIGILTMFGLAGAMAAFTLVSGLATTVMGAFNGVLALGRVAMMLFNVALWANPITWVVGGVLLLGAALTGLVVYWDRVTAALEQSVIFQLLRLQMQALGAGFDLLVSWVGVLMDTFGSLFSYLGTTPMFKAVLWGLDKVTDGIGLVVKLIGQLIGKFWELSNKGAAALKSVADNGLVKSVMGWFGDDKVDPAVVPPVVNTPLPPAVEALSAPPAADPVIKTPSIAPTVLDGPATVHAAQAPATAPAAVQSVERQAGALPSVPAAVQTVDRQVGAMPVVPTAVQTVERRAGALPGPSSTVQAVQRVADPLPPVAAQAAPVSFEAPALTQAVTQTLVGPVQATAPTLTQVIETVWQGVEPQLPESVQVAAKIIPSAFDNINGALDIWAAFGGDMPDWADKLNGTLNAPVFDAAQMPAQAPDLLQTVLQRVTGDVPTALPELVQSVIPQLLPAPAPDEAGGVMGIVPQLLGAVPGLSEPLPVATQLIDQVLGNVLPPQAASLVQTLLPPPALPQTATVGVSPVLDALPPLQALSVGVMPVLGKLAGLDALNAVNDGGALERVEKEKADLALAAPSLNDGPVGGVVAGGLLQQITNAVTNNKGNHIEKLEVNTTQPVDPWLIEDALTMA